MSEFRLSLYAMARETGAETGVSQPVRILLMAFLVLLVMIAWREAADIFSLSDQLAAGRNR